MAAALLLAVLAYAPGLGGGWFFDDLPNIVNNPDVQPASLDIAALANAALSSPASDIGRPLASLSFVANHALGGLDPLGWKLVNLAIHLANGWLVYLLTLALCDAVSRRGRPIPRAPIAAALVAAAWLVLPVNLTAVLYVVQRMESLANLCVLLGLLGYVRVRLRMQRVRGPSTPAFGLHSGRTEEAEGLSTSAFGLRSGRTDRERDPSTPASRLRSGRKDIIAAIASLFLGTAVGVLAKESAVLLPLHAFFVEALLFGFRDAYGGRDRRIVLAFALLLVLPAVAGLALLAPWLLADTTWAARDFALGTRVLSEARIVAGYVGWILLPLPQWLSFYHDHFVVSTGLMQPWTTLAGLLALAALAATAWVLRARAPLVSLGLAFFLGGHALTGSVLPLELVYEHRNYFPSFGLLLALVPLLVAPFPAPALPRHALLALLFAWWIALTTWTAWSWGDPLRLAADLAARAPASARAQFGHGQALLKASGYENGSPLLAEAFVVLERASGMPRSSILPEQTMILTRSLMHGSIEARWWDRLVAKLAERAPNSEDADALGALTRCARAEHCELPRERMLAAFEAAESHPLRSPTVLRIHADYAWNLLGDRALGERLADEAVQLRPRDVDARIALARMNIVLGNHAKAREQVQALEGLNTGGRLDAQVAELNALIP